MLQSVCEPICSSPLFFSISFPSQFYKSWAYFLYPAYCTNYVRHVLDNPFRYHSTNNQSIIKGRSYSSFQLIRCTIFGVIGQTRYPLCVPLKPQCNSQKKDEKYPSIISGLNYFHREGLGETKTNNYQTCSRKSYTYDTIGWSKT